MLIALKDKIKRWIYKRIPPPYTNETFSQAGEDCCIEFLFSQIKINKPTYLELGVYDGKSGSNTYKFYKNGARGVLVEADVSLIQKIKEERKGDIIISAGVGLDKEEVKDFYIFEVAAHNTFNQLEAENRVKNGSYKLIKIEKVKLIPIRRILDKYFPSKPPDFLSIDIEGMDLDVLQNIPFDIYPIPVICAETCHYSETHIKEKNRTVEAYLLTKNYFIYADTYINTIFVNKDWFLQMK